MPINVRQIEKPDSGAWNQRVESVPEGTLHQSTHLEDFHKVTGGGHRPVYLLAEDENGRVLGQLAMLRGFFVAPELIARPWLKNFLPWCGRLLRTYTWTQGPLVFEVSRHAEVFAALLAGADALAGRDGCMVREASAPVYFDATRDTMAQRAFEAAGFARQRRATFCVDLTQTPETLWERLKPAARKNLRKLMAAEELVVSPLETESDLEAYWQMLRETHRRDDRALAYRSLEDLAESFWRRPHALGLLRGILVRTREGAPVAGLLYRCYNGWIQELGVAYTDFSLQQKIYGQDLIKWEIIRQGQLQGARRYDLMGVEVDSPDPKKRGIYQFKEKWGGQLVEFGVYNKTYSSWKAELLRCGTSVARRLRGRARERG